MNGVHFALQIKGDSMLPRIEEGDTVLVQKDFGMMATLSSFPSTVMNPPVNKSFLKKQD